MSTSHTPGPIDFVGLQVFTQGRAEDEQEAGDLECAKIYGDLHSLACNAPKAAAERDRLRDALKFCKAVLNANGGHSAKERDIATARAEAALAGTPETDRLRASNAELLAALKLAEIVVTKAVREGRCPSGVENAARTAIANAEGRS